MWWTTSGYSFLRHLYSPWATWFDIFIILFNDVNRFYVWIKCLKVLRPTAWMYVRVCKYMNIYINIIKKERNKMCIFKMFSTSDSQAAYRHSVGNHWLNDEYFSGTTESSVCMWRVKLTRLLRSSQKNHISRNSLILQNKTSLKRHIRYPCYLCFKTERAGHLHSL